MKEEKTVKQKKKTNKKNKNNVVKKNIVKKNYYMFKMNTVFLNVFSIFLLVLACLFFYFIYGKNSINILNNNFILVMFLYVPYLIFHEVLHSISYVIYGADFKNITYGAYLEKGILCCLCKQNINKRNILHSLLAPFIYIGVVTLIIGIYFDIPVLVILSLSNIAGCSGDFVMFYHLSKLKNFEFSEYNDPIAFGLYTKDDFSKLKMTGLEYVSMKSKLDRTDLKKIRISGTSILLFILFYILLCFTLFIK